MTSYYNSTMRHTSSQKNQLNLFNNNKNDYTQNSNYNNNRKSNQNQYTNNTSLDKNLPNYNNKTSTLNYQIKNNKNSFTVNHRYQTNNSNHQRNNSSLTNKNNQDKNNNNINNNISYNRNDNNNNLYKSNDNYPTNKRRNHNFFERVIINTNANPNTTINKKTNTYRNSNANTTINKIENTYRNSDVNTIINNNTNTYRYSKLNDSLNKNSNTNTYRNSDANNSMNKSTNTNTYRNSDANNSMNRSSNTYRYSNNSMNKNSYTNTYRNSDANNSINKNSYTNTYRYSDANNSMNKISNTYKYSNNSMNKHSNTYKNTNANNSMNKSSNTYINSNANKIVNNNTNNRNTNGYRNSNAKTTINININKNYNEDKNRRYFYQLPDNNLDILNHTMKIKERNQNKINENKIEPTKNTEQNKISKFNSFNTPINTFLKNYSKNNDNNKDKEKSYKNIRAYYKQNNTNKEVKLQKSIIDEPISKSINKEDVLKNSINNEIIHKNIINKDNIISKSSLNINNKNINQSINDDNIMSKSSFNINNDIKSQDSSKMIDEILNRNANNDIKTKNSFNIDELANNNTTTNQLNTKTSNNKIINKELTKEQILFNVIKKEIGIMNLGNTCFINACLQILIHCPIFIYKLIKNKNLINENTPITSNFLSICNIMANTEESTIDISDFKNILGLKHEIYESYMQNDSQEFCRILLEDISRELNEIKVLSIYKILSNSDRKTKKERDVDFHENFIQREKSIIIDLFYAQILNIYKCECNAEIYSFQKILDFPLLFPNDVKAESNDVIYIKDLLKLYFQTEYIDFETICDKCKKKAKHKKEIKISRPPEILILSLQRIDAINKIKLEFLVNFPQTLDLYEFMEHDCGYDGDCKYEIFAIMNHMGGINSGHYYSFIKIENKKWVEFNDSKVIEIDNLSDTSESAYALFYIKKKYVDSIKYI